MTKRVSLREVVATKIIYALILTAYYWTWARTDWKSYYETIQIVLVVFFLVFLFLNVARIRKYKKENWDEMAEQNLRRCDAICLKILVTVMVITAFAAVALGHLSVNNSALIGWIIMGTIVTISIIRTVLFYIMDTKGI